MAQSLISASAFEDGMAAGHFRSGVSIIPRQGDLSEFFRFSICSKVNGRLGGSE
jgi:hypothetical protein